MGFMLLVRDQEVGLPELPVSRLLRIFGTLSGAALTTVLDFRSIAPLS